MRGVDSTMLEHFVGLGNELTFFHRLLLADRVRTSAFTTAIRDLVRPDSTVVDLGTGTGVLASAAAQAGAQTVYALEGSAVARVADELMLPAHRQRVQLVNQWAALWQ